MYMYIHIYVLKEIFALPKGAQRGPKITRQGPRDPPAAPITPLLRHRNPQIASLLGSPKSCSKVASPKDPRSNQKCPLRSVQKAPRRPKSLPKGAQTGPKTSRRAPGTPQQLQ